jgi:hypothetical protein
VLVSGKREVTVCLQFLTSCMTWSLGAALTSSPSIAIVSDQNRNSHFRTKTNIRLQKTTEYSVSAEYSTLLLTFGRKEKMKKGTILTLCFGGPCQIFGFGRIFGRTLVSGNLPSRDIRCLHQLVTGKVSNKLYPRENHRSLIKVLFISDVEHKQCGLNHISRWPMNLKDDEITWKAGAHSILPKECDGNSFLYER